MSSTTNGQPQALIIDDDEYVRQLVADVLREDGWNVVQAPFAEDAFDRIDEARWSAIFCEVPPGDANGYSMLRHFKQRMPEAKIVLMRGGHGVAAAALETSAFGAYDYLLKPFGPEELHSLSRALREQLADHPERSSPTRRSAAYHSDVELVGRSQAFLEVMKQVGRASSTNLPVLLTGEAGTGKKVVASAIHRRSERGDRLFMAINCRAVSGEATAAELFGPASGGTLFLDEITEADESLQARIIEVLQSGDVRVVAASNRSVEQEVAAGRFREDLLSLLNGIAIVLPPLRERREDIPPLAQTFADRIYSLSPSVQFSNEALLLLERYDWPGNVRELENAVLRAAVMCDGTIRVKDLPQRVRNYTMHEPVTSDGTDEEWVTLSEIEGRYVARVLEYTGGNKQAAARVLAVDRKTLDRMIKRHHIDAQHARAMRARASARV